jgi:hypothetical protein
MELCPSLIYLQDDGADKNSYYDQKVHGIDLTILIEYSSIGLIVLNDRLSSFSWVIVATGQSYPMIRNEFEYPTSNKMGSWFSVNAKT